jgi:hypothetical protein
MDANSHVKSLEILILAGFSDLFDDLDHFYSALNYFLSFVNDNIFGSPALINLTIIPHNHIAISNSMHLIHPILLTQLIKPRKQFGKKIDDFSWIFHILTKRCESNHVGEQKSLIIELINLSFLVLDDCQNVEWYELADQDTDVINFDVENSLVVKTFPLNHLSMVDSYG